MIFFFLSACTGFYHWVYGYTENEALRGLSKMRLMLFMVFALFLDSARLLAHIHIPLGVFGADVFYFIF